ncbi:polysaccharide biosynthesis protein [Aeromonas jandaei]|uniref:polysaccharide biosynthesis protein n=1 Tax=Aeromonas jandaei TaxID=650 RepID=UPI003EC83265
MRYVIYYILNLHLYVVIVSLIYVIFSCYKYHFTDKYIVFNDFLFNTNMGGFMFLDKKLLITGGTGSFGNAVLRRFIDTDISEIRIFSRDEKNKMI